MIFIFVALAVALTNYKDDIKFIEAYSVFAESPQIKYELKTKDKNNNDLDKLIYQPVVSSFTGMSFSTESITLAFSVQGQDTELKELEESRLFDLQFLGHYQRFLWEVYYQNYRGIYITDDEDIDNTNLPTANSFSYGFNLKFFHDAKFHPKNSLSSFSNKKKDDWSWLYGVYANRAQLSSNNGLIPIEYQANFEQLFGLREMNTQAIGLDTGFGGLSTFGSAYFSMLFALGMQLQEQRFSGIDQPTRQVTGMSSNFLIDLGNDASWGTLGVQLRYDSLIIPVRNAEYNLSRTLTQFYYKSFF